MSTSPTATRRSTRLSLGSAQDRVKQEEQNTGAANVDVAAGASAEQSKSLGKKRARIHKRSQSLGGERLAKLMGADEVRDMTPERKKRRSMVPGRSILKSTSTGAGGENNTDSASGNTTTFQNLTNTMTTHDTRTINTTTNQGSSEAKPSPPVDEGDETKAMDMTTAFGGIISEPTLVDLDGQPKTTAEARKRRVSFNPVCRLSFFERPASPATTLESSSPAQASPAGDNSFENSMDISDDAGGQYTYVPGAVRPIGNDQQAEDESSILEESEGDGSIVRDGNAGASGMRNFLDDEEDDTLTRANAMLSFKGDNNSFQFPSALPPPPPPAVSFPAPAPDQSIDEDTSMSIDDDDGSMMDMDMEATQNIVLVDGDGGQKRSSRRRSSVRPPTTANQESEYDEADMQVEDEDSAIMDMDETRPMGGIVASSSGPFSSTSSAASADTDTTTPTTSPKHPVLQLPSTRQQALSDPFLSNASIGAPSPFKKSAPFAQGSAPALAKRTSFKPLPPSFRPNPPPVASVKASPAVSRASLSAASSNQAQNSPAVAGRALSASPVKPKQTSIFSKPAASTDAGTEPMDSLPSPQRSPNRARRVPSPTKDVAHSLPPPRRSASPQKRPKGDDSAAATNTPSKGPAQTLQANGASPAQRSTPLQNVISKLSAIKASADKRAENGGLDSPLAPQSTSRQASLQPPTGPLYDSPIHSVQQRLAALASPSLSASAVKPRPSSSLAVGLGGSRLSNLLPPSSPALKRVREMEAQFAAAQGERDHDSSMSSFASFEEEHVAPPAITLNEFLELTRVQFMEDMFSSTKQAKHEGEDRRSGHRSAPSLADHIVLAGATIPTYEGFKIMKRELQEDLDETAMVLAEIESEVERDQHALFKEWFLATDQQRAIMETQFKLTKTLLRHQVRREWYEYRAKVQTAICETMDRHIQGVDKDLSLLRETGAAISSQLPDLRLRREKVQQELEAERRRAVELDSCDKDHLDGLRSAIAEQGAVLQEQEREYADVRGQLSRLNLKVNELESEAVKERELADSARKVCEEIKCFTKPELFRLKDEYDALQVLHSWRLVSFATTRLSFVHCDELIVELELRPPQTGGGSASVGQVRIEVIPEKLAKLDDKSQMVNEYLINAVKVAMKQGDRPEDPTGVLHRIGSLWNASRQLRAAFHLVNLRYPIKFEQHSSRSRSSVLPILQCLVRVRSKTGKADFTVAFDFTGEEIQGDALDGRGPGIGGVGVKVEVNHGSIDRDELVYTIREAVERGGRRALVDACIEAEKKYD